MGGDDGLLDRTVRGAAIGGFVGASFGALAATWRSKAVVASESKTMTRILSHSITRPTALFGAAAGAYSLVSYVGEDYVGSPTLGTAALSGCAAGFVVGASAAGNPAKAFAMCGVTGAAMAVGHYYQFSLLRSNRAAAVPHPQE